MVSILVVAYNSRDFIADCLNAIPAACGDFRYEILLIDNGTDGTGDLVGSQFPDVKVVPSQGNVGFGQGNNILARHADPAAAHVLMLNPDTQVRPNAIANLIQVAHDYPQFGMLGGKMETPSDKPSSLPLVILPSLTSLLFGVVGLSNQYAKSQVPPDTQEPVVQVEAMNGGFMLVRRSLWDEVDGFDDSFFLYGEDADLCRRVTDAGSAIGLVKGSVVFHDVGSGSIFSPVRQRFKMIAEAHYANIHFRQPHRILFKGALWLQSLTRFLASKILSWRGERYDAMAKAYQNVALKPWIWFGGFDTPDSDPRRLDN